MCSDQRGVLYPFNPFYKLNPGETKMVGKDELREMSRELGNKEARLGLQAGVDAVLLQDILSSVSSHSVVIKMDIEGYECKVLLCDATIFFRILFRLCKHQFFLEKVESLFLLSSWSGTKLLGE